MSQNTVAITLPGDGCVLTASVSGTQALPTDDSELYSLAHDNEQVSSTVTRRERKSIFDIKRFNKVLHTDALVAICSYES